MSCLGKCAGYIRAVIFQIPLLETIGITSSLAFIAVSSILLGKALPLAMKALGIDPAHSSRKYMHIISVFIHTFVCCQLFYQYFTHPYL